MTDVWYASPSERDKADSVEDVAKALGRDKEPPKRGDAWVAYVATRKAEKNLPQNDRITWNDLTPIVDAWSKNFRAALDDARGPGGARQ